MKNKKAIIILIVLILLFLITGVSANDVNTTEISASDTKDVTSIDNDNLNDNDYLMDESADLDDTKIVGVSSDENSTVQTELDNNIKENVINNNLNELEASTGLNDKQNINEPKINNNNVLLLATNSEILGLNNDNNILRGSITSVSFTSTSAYVTIQTTFSSSTKTTSTLMISVGSYSKSFDVQLIKGSNTINEQFSITGSFTPGITYTCTYKIRVTTGDIDGGTTSVTYPKSTPTVTISSSKSINYNTGTYSVSGTCSVNGLTITLKAGSTTLGTATTSGGKWTVYSISSTQVPPNSYTLTATSTETTNYNSASGTNTLTVSKSTPTVTVTNKNVNYNTGTFTLGGTVKVGSNNVGTGSITIYKDGVQIGTATVSGGSWTSSEISSTLYDAGSYTITASYASNTYYNANSGSGTLTISKVTPDIGVSTSPDIKYGNGVYTVSGTAKYGSNNVDMGTITLKCGDIVLGIGTVSGGLWTVSNIDTTLVDPSPNIYTITAYYEENDNYNAALANNSLTVNKFTPDISIESTTIWYNQSNGGVLTGKVYTYNGDFYSGFIDLYLNGELIASDVDVSGSGSWSYTLSSTTNLSPGLYSVRVNWKGNEYTNENSFTENRYTVNRGMVIPIIERTGNIDIGRTEYVYVDVNNIMGGGYLGGMTVTLQGSGITGILEEISDVNGRATFSVPSLGAGKYDDWKVCVVSNDYYYPTMDSFKVGMFYVQYPISITITSVLPSNSTYPEEVIIKGFSDADNPQGNVTLWLGGKTYTGFFDSTGNFTASLVAVKPGTYNNITTKYNPTEDEFYYRGVESTVSIPETIINKYLPEIKVLASSITNNMYPGNVTITGTVKGAQGYLIPSGRIEALYNGRVYGNAILDDDGSFVIYAYDLPRGEYNLTINYVGDDYYLNNTQSTENFTVNPSPVKFNITVVNGTYNVDEVSTTIQVELSGIYGGSDIAKGIIRLEINGRYWDATIDDTGRALVEIKSLNAGDYSDVILRYIKSDDELSFVDTDTTVDFTIFKADPGLSVRAPTIGAGKDGSIFITLNDNVSGVVNLTVGNFNIILNVTAGQNRTYVIPQPPVGANRVIANYSGDVNFNSSIAETMLYIERPESYLNYTVTNISYGQSEDLEFKIYLDEDLTKLAVNATGTIRVYGLDKNYKVDVTGGLAYLSVDKLTKGTWTIVAIYSGNDELGGSDKDDKFTVTGISTPLTITVDNSSVIAGNDIIVTVSVNDTINDPIKLYVDGKLYYFNATVNGVTSFVLRNLSYASYNITAVFDGNDGFEGSSNNTTVSVYRIDVNPNIDISYNRDIVFNITVPSETSGNIRIKGNGTDTLLPITDNRATLTLYNVTRGDYKFNISYDGNWKYLPFNTEKTFTVNPVDDYNLTIESTNAEFNKTVTITVTAFGDLEGKFINLTVDGVNKGSAEVIDGLATFNNIYLVSNTTGEFEVIASYDGDNTYASKSFTLNVPVIPTKDYIMGLKALDLVYVGDNILINITAPELINNLNITINGKTQLITREDFIYHIDDIDEGEYNILVSYAGDKAYASKTNTTSFNVIKKDSNIIIETGDIYYNDDEVINISVSDGVSGYVLVTIDNKTSKYDLNGNATQIIRNDFTAGLHNVTVVYPGDRKYNSFTKTGNFTVFKDYDYNMVVSENGTVIVNNSVLHKFVDHTLVVDVALPSDATGNLSFKLYDTNHNLITNWTNVLPKNLINYELREVTNYTLEIFYTGDSNYENNTFVFDINVHKFLIDADASFVDNPYFVLSDSLLNITSNLNDRQIRVYIDGIYYTLTDIIHDNKTVINLSKLSAGNHTVSLMYNGDEYYTSLFATHNITVSKLESSVNVTASSVRTDNNVIVDVNASGNGSANIVILNGMNVLGNYNITITNGKGSFILPNRFVNGTYDLIITYLGDEIYYPNVNSTTFNVTDKIQSDLNITRPTFIVNTPSTVDVTTNFPTGTVSVYVDGIRQDNITVNNRAGIISLAGLSAGNHTILVTYAGDYNYTELTKSFDIFVEKHNSTVNVTATSVRTGNPVVVSVNASGSGSANIVIFNNTMVLGSYNITVNNGKGSFIVPLTFVEGTYNLNITYYGDDVYYGSKNTTVFAVTDRIVSDLNITRPIFVVNTPSTVDVTANFPSGSVSVYVDGKKQNNININAGKGVIDLEGLSAGNHTIQLVFDGNYDYTNATESFNIFVEKLNSSVNVTATSVRTGNPVIVSVNASGSGSANIVIFNNTMVLGSYNITINDGKGSFIVPLTFVEGTYNLNITYYGDDIYYGNKNTTVFTVTDRIQSVIDFIEPAGYIVNKTITIGLSTNFPTGEITVYVDGKKQTTIVNINNNEGTLDLGILSNGNHTIQVTYNGDYDYTETSNNITIDVLKLNTTIAITVDEIFYVDDLVEITINVNKSATGYISVNVNNKDYRLKITEGVAKLNITDLKENTYTIYAEYLGDDYFYGNDTDDAFIVSKIPVSIVIPESIVVGDDLVIDFTNNHADNDEITGVLNITIGSENIVVNVVKGMASIPVSRLPEKPDTYDVVANYSGNYKFNNTILNTALMIKKLTTHTASADANVTIDENLTVIITGDRGYGVDGNLTVSVNNGDSFIIPVNNGIAVIPSDKLPQVMRDNIITIKYSNGTFYADKDFTLNVHSDKITVYDFIISNATVRFGENATLEINLPKDVTTSLTVKINDDTKTVNINDGYGKLENICNLHAGDNSVAATFTSDKYETSTANANILVVPNDITLNITVPSEQLYVDQSATINVKANVSMDNSVTVYVNGKAQTVNLTNGEGGFTIDPLVYGDYVFTAILDGNENYTYTIASEKSFSVDKNNITLNVTSSNVIVGHDVNIKVNINDDATGLVIVKVNNVEYSLNVTNNEYTLSVPNLGNGTYTITAKYYGDDKYYGFENTTSVEVLKLTPSISANDTILIGEDLIITVENATSLVDKATGKLNLTIDNFGIIEANVVNGIAVIKASDLPQVNNTYSASVNYYGDNNYYSLIQAITFTINKVPEVIITVPSNVTIDDELIITVGDSTTDGKLNVTIGGGNEFSVEVVNGIAVIPVSELPQVSDNYNISIYYHGGSYWNNLEYNTTFHADKITVYPFNITNPTIRFGENATLEITLPNDVNTTLTIKINDITSTVDIKKGYGKLENISGLHAKANSVSATFGNGKYETTTATSTIQVDPNDMTLTITVPTEQLYVDQSATISIKANVSMNNSVTVYVNGKAQTVKLTNGEGGFTITPLVYGDYVFTAIFDGNENYTYTTASEKSFSVDKINITLNVTTSNVVVGHDININVNINDDATGLVIVKVDNSEYSLNIGNKEYTLSVSGLSNGTHNIVVKYYGDDKYYGDENSTTVEILKLTPSIAFSSDILIAEDFIISITNSSSRVENPSGKLIFTINGNPVEVDVVNGVATIKASDLPVTDNTYTASIEYSGDNNYYPLTETVTFTINKVPRLVITVPSNVTIDDELIISVGDDTTDGKLNVTIGSGEKFTVNVINGTATIPVKYLPQKSNIYAIALDYYDGSYWNDTSVVRSFHADKITDYPFIISNDTIKFDGIATLRFTLPGDVNTTLTVIIDDIVKTVSITDGHGVLSIANLHAGVNLVSTSFGNDKYETSTATGYIRVLANEITLNITVPTEQLYVDQSATVSVQANVSMNNSVILYINGKAETIKLLNGKGNFTINPLVYGEYVFTALFEGNENYTRANAEMKSFTVDKNTPSITVSVEDILVDEDALVIISNLPEDSKGIVLININGTVYSINTVKGEGNLTVPGLKYGKYNVTVNFTGDDKYHSNINTTSFSVWKNAIGEIKVRSETIKDNKTQVTVTVEKHDTTGEVIITTPNGEYIGKFLDGKTVIEVTDLTSVETPFNITYVGDAKYLSNTTNGVIVNEGIFIESWVTVSAPDIMVDEKTLITVNVPDDATGFVKITVNGKTIQLPLVDAVATFKIGDLPAGEQTITVTYLGDDKYYNNTNSTTFHVNKYSTSISVEADDGMAGTPTTVTVKANASDVNGNVTVTVNGVNFTGNMENGIAVLNVTIDNAGDNVITAVYEGNTYYNTSTASGSVNMDYADAFVNVDAGDINVGEDAIIMVTLPDDATGNVTLTLNDNNDYKPLIIENGTAKFSISDLSADTYNVVVKYLGDNKYSPQSNATVFVVSKVEVSPSTGNNTSVEVIKNDNGTTTINITVPDDATGNVTVTVDGKNYTVPIVNGTASVTVDNLNNDSNVSITYSGDDKYDGFNQTTVINSDGNVQFTPTLTITTQNINVGDTAIITVNLPSDATGTVTITVNGQTYTEAVSNGSAVFNVSGLSNATHIITASYNGDKKYLKVSNTSSIAVSKIKTSIGVKASDINVGDTESITVTVNVSDATGSVSITVDGKNYTSSISGGQAVFSINALAEGTYTIKATYNGDNKYLISSNDTVSFTVSKNSISPVGDNKTSVEVTPNDNGTATVTVNVPSDATGNVTVTVDGKNYTVPVVNGTASVVVDDYTNGSNISVSYSGDDKYDGFNHTGVLSDDGVKFNIDMTVTSDKEVYVAGETAVITITLPEDSTGNVTIMVNNKPVDTVLLSSGNIVFDYIIPSKGGFTVEAIFNGDKKYTAVHNSTVFTAVKANSTIIINVDDTPYDKNPVITVILPDDASGNVTITVDGKDYTEEVSNGKAVFNLPLLDRDTYTVTAVYSGDDKYNGNNNQSEFDVVNKVADLDIKVDSIVYGETANVTVKVADNMTGYITVTSGDNTYFAFIENGTAKLSVPGLEPGLNNITIYYSGDNDYQEKTVTSVIPVARLSSGTEVFVEDITQGDVLNVTVRVSGDASGNVTITIAGKNYTGTLDNGMVIIPVSGLGPGNYTVTALYLGDKYYNESSDVSSFVVKANMTVFAYEMTRGYNSGMDYSVYLTDDLGNPLVNTNVVISVGGVDYNVRTDSNGIASLNAKLAVGSHTISIVNPVTGEETHSNLTIAPRLIENKNLVTYYNSGYVYKVRVIGDDGNPVGAGVKFTIKINGKSYTYTTDKDGYLNIKINKRFTASSSKKNRVYKISLSYKGYTVKNTITIKQVLKSKRIVKVKKSAKKIVLKATLKQGKKALKGKVIKFKFKGKTYKAKTNKKGIAKVKISKKVLRKLKAGKNYKVKITYLTDTIKTYVKVKK